MGESLTVSARLQPEHRDKLERILNGKSLGLWLQEVIDGHESVDNLEARAKELERTVKDREEKARELEEKLECYRSSLDQLQALRKAGVSPEELARWSITLRELEGRERKLEASVRALEGKRGELEGAVSALKDSALSAIAKLKEKGLAELEDAARRMREKIEAYGEACRLSEVLDGRCPLRPAFISWPTPNRRRR